jgi:hypothetical protein
MNDNENWCQTMALLIHSHTSDWEKGSIVSEEVVGKSPGHNPLQKGVDVICNHSVICSSGFPVELN